MIGKHDDVPISYQTAATQSQFEATVERLAAHLAGAPGEFAHEDVALLVAELQRQQRASAARDAELQRLRDALQMSEARLNLMQENANTGVWDWNLQTNAVTVTAQVESLHGLAPGALQHYQDWRQRVHPEDIERIEVERDAAIAEHRPFAVEFRVVTDDGGFRWIAGRGQAIYAANGEAVRIVGINQDITERKLVADALRVAQQRLDAHIDNSPLAVIEFDPAFRVIRWSQGATRMFGWRPEETIGKAIFELRWVHVEDSELVRQTSAAMLSRCNTRSLNVNRNYRKDGAVIHCAWYSSAVYDDAGRLISVMSQVLDITERVRAEADLKQSQQSLMRAQQLGHLGNWEWDVPGAKLTWSDELYRIFGIDRTFPLTYDRIEAMQKMETVGRLAGGVAHEFNNLLAVILLRTEMSLPLVEPTSPLHHSLTTILTTAQRSAELVRQLLGFARKQVIDPKVLDLNAVIEATLPMLHKVVGEEIKLVLRQETFLWPIKMDQTQIDQILANLCVNACDAIDGAGAITIETSNATMTQDEAENATVEAAGDYVLLSVTDTGYGMDQETLARVFEPFFTTKEVGKGTGLGLPMVKGIMQQNHGHIQVFSEPSHGTTIKLYFPRHLEALPIAAPSQPPTLPVGQRETVLLVEDEPILLQMSTDVLEFLGYVVIAAATPQEALQAVEDFSGKIELVMTDIVMPEMNGVELVARLTVTHPGIKRLFVSGYSADYIAHRGVLEDDVHFLQKPYTLQALAAKLREVLDGTGYAVAPYSRV